MEGAEHKTWPLSPGPRCLRGRSRFSLLWEVRACKISINVGRLVTFGHWWPEPECRTRPPSISGLQSSHIHTVHATHTVSQYHTSTAVTPLHFSQYYIFHNTTLFTILHFSQYHTSTAVTPLHFSRHYIFHNTTFFTILHFSQYYTFHNNTLPQLSRHYTFHASFSSWVPCFRGGNT